MTSERAREVRSWNIENPTLETKRYDQIDAFSYRTRYFLTKTHENPKSWKKFFNFFFPPIFLNVYFTHVFKGVLWDLISGLKRFSKINFFAMWDEVKSNDPRVEKHSSGHPLPGSNFIFRIKSIFKKIASKPPMVVLLMSTFFF